MQRMQRVPLGLMVWALTFGAAAQQPMIYPAKGQSPQKQNSDTAECQLWAKQTTGVDPVAIAQQSGQPAPGKLLEIQAPQGACITSAK
jgi:hypothetical protein